MEKLNDSSPLLEPKDFVEVLEHSNDLRNRLGHPQVFILDCTWLGLPIFEERDPKAEFDKMRIPFAHYFDLDECCDQRSPLPHMMPTCVHFQEYLANICTTSAGIYEDKIKEKSEDTGHSVKEIDLNKDVFILYDTIGVWSAPRVWWMLKCFGVSKTFILNGGISEWINQGYRVDVSPFTKSESTSLDTVQVTGIEYNEALIESLSDIRKFVLTPPEQRSSILIDSRPYGRFIGEDPEPRPGIPSGHIPGSLNVPWNIVLKPLTIQRDRSTLSGLLNGSKGTFIEYQYFIYLAPDELAKILSEKLTLPFNHNSKLMFSCGSGVSSAIVLLAAIICQFANLENASLFDGSWTEWKLNDLGLLKSAP